MVNSNVHPCALFHVVNSLGLKFDRVGRERDHAHDRLVVVEVPADAEAPAGVEAPADVAVLVGVEAPVVVGPVAVVDNAVEELVVDVEPVHDRAAVDILVVADNVVVVDAVAGIVVAKIKR